MPIHPADRLLLLLLLLRESESRRPIKNRNHRVSTYPSSSRTPPPSHITGSSSSSTLIPRTPINLTLRGGYSPTLSGNDTPSSTTHHNLYPFDDESISFFSSTRGLLDYDLVDDTWVPSAAAPNVGAQGKGAARVAGLELVTKTGTRRFLPWYGKLLAENQLEEEEEAELRWARERVWIRGGGMNGRYVNETGAGEKVGGVDGAVEEAREADGVEDEVEEERGQKRDTSEEELEERRKIRAEDWKQREEEREKIEALLAAEGSGVENEGNG
ncbi:hypothetical protein N7G274_010055 [Stereocaulon virgatum]|uniref:Uncharacterized protein n=1 Tax=Stereocaulon virgatum TaxID=373712 RepID=A0ABR3ZUD5_9LECA